MFGWWLVREVCFHICWMISENPPISRFYGRSFHHKFQVQHALSLGWTNIDVNNPWLSWDNLQMVGFTHRTVSLHEGRLAPSTPVWCYFRWYSFPTWIWLELTAVCWTIIGFPKISLNMIKHNFKHFTDRLLYMIISNHHSMPIWFMFSMINLGQSYMDTLIL